MLCSCTRPQRAVTVVSISATGVPYPSVLKLPGHWPVREDESRPPEYRAMVSTLSILTYCPHKGLLLFRGFSFASPRLLGSHKGRRPFVASGRRRSGSCLDPRREGRHDWGSEPQSFQPEAL